MGMGMKSLKWDGFGTKNLFPLISNQGWREGFSSHIAYSTEALKTTNFSRSHIYALNSSPKADVKIRALIGALIVYYFIIIS